MLLNGDGEKWLPLGYTLEVKGTGFANGLDVGNDRKKKKINDDS